MKTCTACKLPKPESEFHTRGDSDRLRSRCKDCHNAGTLRFYRKNKSKWRAAEKQYRKRHPDKIAAKLRTKRHRQRARLRNLSDHHTEAEWQSLLNKFDRRCLRCGIEEMFAMLTRDHVIPLSRGGSNTIDNIQPLCVNCNELKGTVAVDYRPIHVNRNQ